MRKKTLLVWPTHNTCYKNLVFEVIWKNWRTADCTKCKWQFHVEAILLLLWVFPSLECWLQSTPPVSAPNVSKAKGPCLGALRHLLAPDLNALPKRRQKNGKKRWWAEDLWSFWLIRAGATKQGFDWKSSSGSGWSPGKAPGSRGSCRNGVWYAGVSLAPAQQKTSHCSCDAWDSWSCLPLPGRCEAGPKEPEVWFWLVTNGCWMWVVRPRFPSLQKHHPLPAVDLGLSVMVGTNSGRQREGAM